MKSLSMLKIWQAAILVCTKLMRNSRTGFIGKECIKISNIRYVCVNCTTLKTLRPKCAAIANSTFQRLAVNVLGPLIVTWSGHWYIVVFMEYLTEWPKISQVNNADAITIDFWLMRSSLATERLEPYFQIVRNIFFPPLYYRSANCTASRNWTWQHITHRLMALLKKINSSLTANIISP